MRKSQLQIIDSSLFLYGALLTFFLVITALINLNRPGNIFILIIFFPIAIYFSIKIFTIIKNISYGLFNQETQPNPYFGNFSLNAFINQTEPSFLINLVLLFFATALILLRISMANLK